MQEMTKDEQIAVMQAKIDEMTSAIFAKDRKIEELRKATADRNALEQECIQLRADKKRLRETKREACEALRAKEKSLANFRRCTVINASLYGSLEHRWQRTKSGITALGTRSWRGK